MAQSGGKCWLRKMGEDGVSSFASRMTEEIFVGHHVRTGAVFVSSKHGVVRGTNWTRQPLNDAWKMLRTGMACVARRGKWWLLC